MISSPMTDCTPMMPAATPRLTSMPAARPQTAVVRANSQSTSPTAAPTKVENATPTVASSTALSRMR